MKRQRLVITLTALLGFLFAKGKKKEKEPSETESK